MINLNQSTLDFSIPNELEIIQKKYNELQKNHDLEAQQYLYRLLVEMNRKLTNVEAEIDYFSSYDLFDR